MIISADFTISSAVNKLHKSLIAKILELLTYLVVHMIVIWMFPLQLVDKCIYFIKVEVVIWYSLHTFQHIK